MIQGTALGLERVPRVLLPPYQVDQKYFSFKIPNIFYLFLFFFKKKGPAESMEGDPMMSPRTARRSDHFQSHFARDLAQTLPGTTTTITTTSTNGYRG